MLSPALGAVLVGICIGCQTTTLRSSASFFLNPDFFNLIIRINSAVLICCNLFVVIISSWHALLIETIFHLRWLMQLINLWIFFSLFFLCQTIRIFFCNYGNNFLKSKNCPEERISKSFPYIWIGINNDNTTISPRHSRDEGNQDMASNRLRLAVHIGNLRYVLKAID